MRVVFAFVLFVGLSWAVSDILSGRARDALLGLAIALVSGGLLWRDLRDPEKMRKGGEQARITFTFEPGEGIGPPGTYAQIDTYRRAAWSVSLDRAPRREDMDMYGVLRRGWVWLGADGLPQSVRVDGGMTWESWPVLQAVPLNKEPKP
ncbi:hypothetical protein [Mameliella alba]|uniref:hypothetical protein n=1 Tax=Mameliella alba TaxID=561184 RepID=UPI0014322913|nr:hypothetical protein [Mameliella alba]